MARFMYSARDSAGEAVAGVLEAPSLEDAGRMLRSDGKTIVELSAALVVGATERLRRVRQEDLLYFSNQLAVMVDTGVPLTEALDSIAEETTHNGLKAMVTDIANQVKGGIEFSAALGRYPKVFSELYVNMVGASEASGTMGPMLERLCGYMRTQRQTRKDVAGAMLYPCGILGFSLLILVLMMAFVLPRFEKIYAGKQAVLPGPTRALLNVSHVMTEYWAAILGGALVVGSGIYMYLSSPAGQSWKDRTRLRLPVVGRLYQKLCISRSLRTLATMLSSGVDVLEAIRITSTVTGNRLYRDMWLYVASRLREGRTLAEEMYDTPLIPPGIAQMIACGDHSGRLSDVMNRVSDFCETDVKAGIKSLTALVEPAMIIIMGAVVGGIAMALLLPIFSISKVIAH